MPLPNPSTHSGRLPPRQVLHEVSPPLGIKAPSHSSTPITLVTRRGSPPPPLPAALTACTTPVGTLGVCHVQLVE